jgi:hypothetical protein
MCCYEHECPIPPGEAPPGGSIDRHRRMSTSTERPPHDVVVERCCGLDVHKGIAGACVRTLGQGGREQQVARTLGTMTTDLLALRDWLTAMDVSLVGMESTGIY